VRATGSGASYTSPTPTHLEIPVTQRVFSRLVETRSQQRLHQSGVFEGALAHLCASLSGKGNAVVTVRAHASLPFPLPIPLIPLVLAGVRAAILCATSTTHHHATPPASSAPAPRPGQPSRGLLSTPTPRMLSTKWLEEPTLPRGGPSRTFRSVLTRAGVCWGRKERKGRLKDEQGATQIEHSQEAQRQEVQRQEAQRQEAQWREAQWLRERERRSKQHQMAAERE